LLLQFVYFPMTVWGRENFPAKGSFILASNHLSNLDPPIISLLLRRRFHFIAKDSLFKNRYFGWFLRNTGTIAIKRESSDFRALRAALRGLQKRPIVIFPEGSRDAVRRAANRGQKSFSGIGFLAAKSQVPVIPIKIVGSDNVMPVHATKLRRYPVKVIIGKPVQFSKDDLYPQITYRIMSDIANLDIPA